MSCYLSDMLSMVKSPWSVPLASWVALTLCRCAEIWFLVSSVILDCLFLYCAALWDGNINCRCDTCHSAHFFMGGYIRTDATNQYLWPDLDHPMSASVSHSVKFLCCVPTLLFSHIQKELNNEPFSMHEGWYLWLTVLFNRLEHKNCLCAHMGSWLELITETCE